MPSIVDIYNLALPRVGVSMEVESTTEKTKVARVCNRLFPLVRDFVLRDFPWPFARRIVALAVVPNETQPGWQYTYDYPEDCVAMRQIVDSAGARILGRSLFAGLEDQLLTLPKIPFQVSLNLAGSDRVVLTDLVEAYGIYTRRVENTDAFDSGFTDALAWRLAGEIGPTLQAEKSYIGHCFEQYELYRQRGGAQSLNESSQDPESDSPSISIRG
jgi:hypothetical protein